MKSHTIPERLLKQFAYFDTITRSLRLWKYSKGKPPYPRASPKTAARIDGYFANPNDARMEALIETKLAYEIEDPVHKLLPSFDDPTWTPSQLQRVQLTRYINLLFNRSEARREGSKHTRDIMQRTVERFVSDESRLLTVAVQWSINAFFRGQRLLFGAKDIADVARAVLERMQTESAQQEAYSELMASMLSGSLTQKADEWMIKGEWRIIRANSSEPFILSDTPVVTWERRDQGFNLGIGFERPNLEVILPVSPTACLQILPDVQRTRAAVTPTVTEVNIIQASFAREACFADRKSDEIDTLLQENIHKLKIGQNVFTLWHRNFDEKFFDIVMQQG